MSRNDRLPVGPVNVKMMYFLLVISIILLAASEPCLMVSSFRISGCRGCLKHAKFQLLSSLTESFTKSIFLALVSMTTVVFDFVPFGLMKRFVSTGMALV